MPTPVLYINLFLLIKESVRCPHVTLRSLSVVLYINLFLLIKESVRCPHVTLISLSVNVNRGVSMMSFRKGTMNVLSAIT
jgi:hypothetical protein